MPKMKLPNPFEYDVITMRGIIIATTIEVERKMDDFLSSHFCSKIERKNQLCELLFFTERITFDMKKQMVFAILETHFKQFKVDNSDFVEKLESIAPHRNVFAHLEIELDKCESVDTPLGTEVSKLVFKKFNSGKYAPKEYTIAKLTEISETMYYVIERLKTLLTEMSPLI